MFRTVSSAARSCRRSLTTAAGELSAEQLASWEEKGYLVLPRFWSLETVAELKDRMQTLLDAWQPESFTVFSTKENNEAHGSDDYFLSSGDKIRFFFEEGAFGEDGQLTVEKNVAINKVGHAMHDLDDVFRRHSYSPQLLRLCHSLGMADPRVAQSMYIFKQPRIGGEVLPHQDGTFLYTTPQSVVGMWWALEDCTTHNGCLWAVPGSHKAGVSRRFLRTPDGRSTMFQPAEEQEWDISHAEKLEVPSGSLVLLHNALVHFSHANHSDKSRHAFTLHVVDGACDYPADNWLQRADGSAFHVYEDVLAARE